MELDDPPGAALKGLRRVRVKPVRHRLRKVGDKGKASNARKTAEGWVEGVARIEGSHSV